MECVYRSCLNNFRHGVADAPEDVFVPLHGRARWQQRGKGIDRGKPVNAIGGCAVYARNGSKTCFHVAVAGCLSAPWATIDIRLSVDDAHDGIVVVHQVTSWDMAQPKTDVGALAGSAFCGEGIAVAILADQ